MATFAHHSTCSSSGIVWMPESVAASFHEKCVWASHMPGISVAPAASITVAPVDPMGAVERPTDTMRLPCTSTLPAYGICPVPSRMRTLVKRTVFIAVLSSCPASRAA